MITINNKFNPGKHVYFMRANKIAHGKVDYITVNPVKSDIATIHYYTVTVLGDGNCMVNEEDLFETKELLLKSL